MNLGVRYDHFNAGTLPIDVPTGTFIPARSYAAFKDISNYHDIAYRFGGAYDLFGNGKTALRGSWGRYLVGLGGQQLMSLAPSNSIVSTTARPWFDANRNRVPDCTLTNLAANGEYGPTVNPGFGVPFTAFTWDDRARKGWGVREYSNQWSVSFQQEVAAGFGIAAGFYHTDFNNTQVAVNTALGASAFTPFCVTAPTDPRIGPASGSQVCGSYNQTFATKAALPTTVWYLAEDAPVPGLDGVRTEIYNGGDVAMNWRFKGTGLLSGGLSLGKSVTDTCFANAHPQITGVIQAGSVNALGVRSDDYCSNQAQSLWNGIGSQVKFQIVYPLPKEFVVAATIKHLPGIPQVATVTYTNNATSACTQTLNVNVQQPGTLFDERLNQVDVRATRRFRIGKVRLQAVAELYNALNDRISQANTETWGTNAAPGVFAQSGAFLRPSLLLGGRLFKFGAQVDF